jgi:hypothetical protein
VKERPILFSGPMVRAILDGSKTQTRRIAKEFNEMPSLDGILKRFPNQEGCPYGTPGDRLWVRETFAQGVEGCPGGISYRADHFDPKGDGPAHPMKWRPSIFMPRASSRILLEITDVRVQRLQEISDEDARAEGIKELALQADEPGAWWTAAPDRRFHSRTPRGAFLRLWREIHGDGSWDANPWVWAITFRRLGGSDVQP